MYCMTRTGNIGSSIDCSRNGVRHTVCRGDVAEYSGAHQGFDFKIQLECCAVWGQGAAGVLGGVEEFCSECNANPSDKPVVPRWRGTINYAITCHSASLIES